jgi:hypothetical protein
MQAFKEWLLLAVLVVVTGGLGYLGITNLAQAELQPDIVRWAIAFVLTLVAALMGASFVAALMEWIPLLRRIGEDGRARVAIVLWLVAGTGIVYAVHDAAVRPLRLVEAGLASVCTGTAVPEAGSALAGKSNHVVVLDATGGQHPWSLYVELGWRPATVADAELVACVARDDASASIEVCTYRGGPDVTRYVVSRDVRVVAARTGEEVAAFTVSHSPRACAQSEERSLTEIRGEPVMWADVASRIRSLVANGT